MIITICGSNRFAKEALEFGEKLSALGAIVYVPHFYTYTVGDLSEVDETNRGFIAMGLTHDHFMKIRLADAIFIYNKDGYSGNSTTLEIGFAVALNKPIYTLSDTDEEVCRKILFKETCTTPEALAKALKIRQIS